MIIESDVLLFNKIIGLFFIGTLLIQDSCYVDSSRIYLEPLLKYSHFPTFEFAV